MDNLEIPSIEDAAAALGRAIEAACMPPETRYCGPWMPGDMMATGDVVSYQNRNYRFKGGVAGDSGFWRLAPAEIFTGGQPVLNPGWEFDYTTPYLTVVNGPEIPGAYAPIVTRPGWTYYFPGGVDMDAALATPSWAWVGYKFRVVKAEYGPVNILLGGGVKVPPARVPSGGDLFYGTNFKLASHPGGVLTCAEFEKIPGGWIFNATAGGWSLGNEPIGF